MTERHEEIIDKEVEFETEDVEMRETEFIIEEDKTLFGFNAKKVKKVAIIAGVTVAGLYILNKISKAEVVEDLTAEDILEGVFEEVGE